MYLDQQLTLLFKKNQKNNLSRAVYVRNKKNKNDISGFSCLSISTSDIRGILSVLLKQL